MIHLEKVRQEIRRFLQEDLGDGDLTTRGVIPEAAPATGWIVSREACIVAGLEFAGIVFEELDATMLFTQCHSDGKLAPAGTRLAEIQGRAAPILSGERLALNLLQRLSGIATLTRTFVDAIAGTSAQITDTRKTTPGLRSFEKYAVRMGGGRNHRAGLYDGVLIKDNHIAVAGGIAPAIQGARENLKSGHPIQIEVDSLEQLDQVLDLQVEAVLLDNMSPERVAQAVQRVRRHPQGMGCWIEASGGITLEDVRPYAEAGVDAISIGALTHSAPAVDIALDLGWNGKKQNS